MRPFDPLIRLFERIPYAFIALLARLSVAWQFWEAGRARVSGGWNILEPRSSTMTMFLGGANIRWIPYEAAAIATQLAEFALPILLAVGLASRLAALGLLVLLIVFEVFVHPGPYALHGTWAALLLLITKAGPGSISLDGALGRRG
ncbi:DoxX family protein [Aestuariivirga sp.]|uniref:DoxX family protein n=1 Tax=Aestuariivirga sp. TaxID=2650926 RepID=UPI0030197A8A